MKKFILLCLVFVLLFVSCRTYTIEEARETIVYPEKGTTPTRLRDIEKEKEEETKEEDAKKTNEYPSSLTNITLPFYYNPLKNKEYTLSEDLTQFDVLFIPLGEENLEEDALKAITAILKDHSFTILALSGSIYNQAQLASMINKDAVTLLGGTIIYDGVVLEEFNENSITLSLTKEKRITIYNKDYHPVFDYTLTRDEILTSIDELEHLFSESLIESVINNGEDKKILFLSSIAPSSLDWTAWTDYEYREDRSFLLSDLLLSLNFVDCYDITRFNEETECGYTRKYGPYEERLDFLYSKGLIVTSSYILPIENLETRAVGATFTYL